MKKSSEETLTFPKITIDEIEIKKALEIYKEWMKTDSTDIPHEVIEQLESILNVTDFMRQSKKNMSYIERGMLKDPADDSDQWTKDVWISFGKCLHYLLLFETALKAYVDVEFYDSMEDLFYATRNILMGQFNHDLQQFVNQFNKRDK